MRAATFAGSIGRGREFAFAAWRSAFQEGVELSVPDNVFELERGGRLAS